MKSFNSSNPVPLNAEIRMIGQPSGNDFSAEIISSSDAISILFTATTDFEYTRLQAKVSTSISAVVSLRNVTIAEVYPNERIISPISSGVR